MKRKEERKSKQKTNKTELDITHVSISCLSLSLGDTFAVGNICTHLLFCLFSLEWLPNTASIYILGEDNSKGYDLDNFYGVE